MSQPVIMWFRQDLRLADNPALYNAAKAGPLICLYILDDETPGKWKWGGASRWWLHKSLESLGNDLKRLGLAITFRRGRPDRVFERLLTETGAKSIYFNREHAPWSSSVEEKVQTAARRAGADCNCCSSFLLFEPETIKTADGNPYRVFTPFSRACFANKGMRSTLSSPRSVTTWLKQVDGDRLSDWKLLPSRPDWAVGFGIWSPGERGASERLAEFIERSLAGYSDFRDHPDRDETSRLSAHLHWGEISPLQCWSAVESSMTEKNGRIDRSAHKFLNELLWREFSNHLLHHWPEFPSKAFQERYDNVEWREDPVNLEAWQKGVTGIPLVDAGMRQLWCTGYMHNRVRMIAASFLIKDLLIDWREGERWFWDTLVDADLANNAASWQWVAGTGADAAPYFRVFNPLLQGEKFDADGKYVRRWIPELRNLPSKWVHRPWQAPQRVLEAANIELGQTYPYAVVDHAFARNRALEAFGKV